MGLQVGKGTKEKKMGPEFNIAIEKIENSRKIYYNDLDYYKDFDKIISTYSNHYNIKSDELINYFTHQMNKNRNNRINDIKPFNGIEKYSSIDYSTKSIYEQYIKTFNVNEFLDWRKNNKINKITEDEYQKFLSDRKKHSDELEQIRDNFLQVYSNDYIIDILENNVIEQANFMPDKFPVKIYRS